MHGHAQFTAYYNHYKANRTAFNSMYDAMANHWLQTFRCIREISDIVRMMTDSFWHTSDRVAAVFKTFMIIIFSIFAYILNEIWLGLVVSWLIFVAV